MVWGGACLNHPSWNGQMRWKNLKKYSLKPNRGSHNKDSWYTDTDGFLEQSPSVGSLSYKGPALQKIILHWFFFWGGSSHSYLVRSTDLFSLDCQIKKMTTANTTIALSVNVSNYTYFLSDQQKVYCYGVPLNFSNWCMCHETQKVGNRRGRATLTVLRLCADWCCTLRTISAWKCWQKIICNSLDFRNIKMMFSSANF